MKLLQAVLVLGLLSACGMPVQKEQELISSTQERIQEIIEAEQGAVLRCNGKEECDKAFALAKAYVVRNAEMKIQHSDEAVISTYHPRELGQVAMSATRTPDIGTSEEIKLGVFCYGQDAYKYRLGGRQYEIFETCAVKILQKYSGFKPFVEPRMKES